MNWMRYFVIKMLLLQTLHSSVNANIQSY